MHTLIVLKYSLFLRILSWTMVQRSLLCYRRSLLAQILTSCSLIMTCRTFRLRIFLETVEMYELTIFGEKKSSSRRTRTTDPTHRFPCLNYFTIQVSWWKTSIKNPFCLLWWEILIVIYLWNSTTIDSSQKVFWDYMLWYLFFENNESVH